MNMDVCGIAGISEDETNDAAVLICGMPLADCKGTLPGRYHHQGIDLYGMTTSSI